LVDDHAVTNFVACTNMMVVGLTFDRHTQQLLTLGWNWSTTRVARWEVPAWRRLSSDLTISTPGLSYDVSPDFCRIATGQVHGGVSVWDLTTGQKWAEFPGNLPTVVKAVAFLDGGAVLAAGGQDGLIRLYDVNQRRELATFRGQMSAVHSLAVSPDGRRLASGGTRPSEAVRLWDVATRKDLLNLECQGSLFGFTGFSPDGNILVASNGKMLMHVWRAPSWAEIEAAEKR
jgi:WD40 repeat protein